MKKVVSSQISRRLFSSWTLGQSQPIPYGTTSNNPYKTFNPKDLKKSIAYNFLISSIIPRPIALISSISSSGIVNCAPFSYFNVMCHDPPTFVVGLNLVASRSGEYTKKDTLVNIEQTGQFVVNIMSEWYVESANHTCGRFPPDVDEIKLAGLTPLPSDVIRPPRVGEAAIQFECEANELKPVNNDSGKHTCTIVIGKIVNIHVHEGVMVKSADGTSDTEKPIVDFKLLRPVGRMGGQTYTIVRDGFDLDRPTVMDQK